MNYKMEVYEQMVKKQLEDDNEASSCNEFYIPDEEEEELVESIYRELEENEPRR